MLKRLINLLTGPRLEAADLTFAEAHDILDRASDEAKEHLARRTGEAQILDYLAGDPKASLRALVACNPKTPEQTDLRLLDDPEMDVRVELARKIGRLIPGLNARDSRKLSEHVLKLIARLADDHLPRVRQIVAEEIKHSDLVPKPVALRLARDAELSVAAPILEYSPLLSDEDLVEIIATSQVEGALAAIARRRNLGEKVSDAVVATLDIPAVAALLANSSAAIRTETMDRIVEHAERIPEWHQGIVLRPDLSLRAIRRISSFVASSLLETIAARHQIDDETRHLISKRVRDRLQAEDTQGSGDDLRARALSAVETARRGGALNDDFVIEAIKRDDRLLVLLGLVQLSGLPEALVEKLLKSGNAQLITAFAWAAGLQMRTAFALQKDIARLGPRDLLPARNGLHYPLTEEQMRTQLEMFGIRKD